MRTNFSRIVPRVEAAVRVLLLLAMLVGTMGLVLTQTASASVAVPVFTVTNVVKDSTVTIKTDYFPADHTFIVRMGDIGTQGIGGIQVGTTYSGTGGSFTAVYDIPDALKGKGQVAIRLEATTGGYYSYNWFWNNPANVSPSSPVYTTAIPTFDVTYVVKDATVTIKSHNFPAHKDFVVRMGVYGTLGIGGTVVGTTNSESGGTFVITYTIPDDLKGQSRIAIRMDATSGGYYSYNWFWNDQATTTGTSGTSYTGIPTFTIAAVVKDNTVTIRTNNFPADRTFIVMMGKYGTLGIGGIEVATTDSGAGGSFEATYTIPAELLGQSRIAVRLESTTGGFYSFGWFWNTTTP